MNEFTILIRFDAKDQDTAKMILSLCRESFCNQTDAVEVDSLVESSKGKVIERHTGPINWTRSLPGGKEK